MKRSRRTVALDNITRLEDAKALRAMGVPLSMSVEERELSAQANKKLGAVFKATATFGDAVLSWVPKQTDKRYKKLVKTWRDLDRALSRTRKWIESGRDTEVLAVAGWIEPCALVCLQWDEIFTALEDGEPVEINVGDDDSCRLKIADEEAHAPWPLGPFVAEEQVIRF